MKSLLDEAGYDYYYDDDDEPPNDEAPPPPHLAQQMLSNRLNNLLILPRNVENGFQDNHSAIVSFGGTRSLRSNAGKF